MSWVKLDDQFVRHPKVTLLTDAAFRVHVRALSYAASNQTDGYLPKSIMPELLARPKQISQLELQGLWEPAAGGWRIHDFLDYNPSAAERRKMREQTAERVRQHRARASNTNGVTAQQRNGVTASGAQRDSRSRPVPDPDPLGAGNGTVNVPRQERRTG